MEDDGAALASDGGGSDGDALTAFATAALEAALKREWDRPALVAYAAARTWDRVAEEIEEYFQSILRARPPAKK